MTAKNKFPLWIFGIVFVIASLLPIISKKLSPSKASFVIQDNVGMGRLMTQGRMLVAVFTDGKTAAWDWSTLDPQPLWQFSADSDRFIMLDDARAAAVTQKDRKLFIIYDVKQGKKLSEIPVGWEDQEVWLVQSPDKKILAIARVNPDKEKHTLYEFMTMDPAKDNPDPSVSIDIPTAEKRLIAFAVSNDKKFLAVGGKEKHGWLIKVDLEQGKTVLDKEYDQTDEFTGVAFVPNGSQAFLTNRNGSVYGIDETAGDIKSAYTVLKPGEKNIVTNDGSSQNVTIDTEGRFVAAVMIEHKVAVWDIQTGSPVFQVSHAHKLTGSIALSQDGSLLATSDKRANGSIRIWRIKK